MTIHYYAALKTAMWVFVPTGIIITAINPNVETALIAAVPGTITGLLLYFSQRSSRMADKMDRQRLFDEGVRQFNVLHEIGSATAAKVDGINSSLAEKLTERNVQLRDVSKQLARAEGVKIGSDSERDKVSKK